MFDKRRKSVQSARVEPGSIAHRTGKFIWENTIMANKDEKGKGKDEKKKPKLTLKEKRKQKQEKEKSK